MPEAANVIQTTEMANANLFTMMMKGGWIMVPLLLLSALAIFIMVDSWVGINKMLKFDRKGFSRILDLIYRGDIEQAVKAARNNRSAVSRIASAGLAGAALPIKHIEDDMQVEARQIMAKAETPVEYLSMIATIAPMLGFLGTIFGVIKIFFNISMSNDLSISSISDGLYQKMICSATGLLVGIVAYLGYYILNRRIDKMVLGMDHAGNEVVKAISISRGEISSN